jgi:hypothetical protein
MDTRGVAELAHSTVASNPPTEIFLLEASLVTEMSVAAERSLVGTGILGYGGRGYLSEVYLVLKTFGRMASNSNVKGREASPLLSVTDGALLSAEGLEAHCEGMLSRCGMTWLCFFFKGEVCHFEE